MPSTDEQQAVHLDFAYPDAERLERLVCPLVKWLLAIPHYIVLFFLYIGVFFAVIGAWFAILFTGRYPRGLFKFVEGNAALAQPRGRLRLHAGHGRLSAVPPLTLRLVQARRLATGRPRRPVRRRAP